MSETPNVNKLVIGWGQMPGSGRYYGYAHEPTPMLGAYRRQCEHEHATKWEALRCASGLREDLALSILAQRERIEAIQRATPLSIRVDGEYGDDRNEPPSMTRCHQDIDEAAMREAVGRE